MAYMRGDMKCNDTNFYNKELIWNLKHYEKNKK